MEPQLRRSLLFVPGDDERKLDRAATAEADTLVLDLEDAVAPDRKSLARAAVCERISSAAFGACEVAVRINSAGTAYFEGDLTAAVSAGARLLMVPKSESIEGIAAVARAVEELETPGAPSAVRLLALVETARGIAHVNAVAQGTDRLDALCFGNADFSLDMGLPEGSLSSGVVYHARCNLAIAAVAARLSPIDGVCLSANDRAAFRDEAYEAARLGFEGKLCIHPSQVEIANSIFTPSDEQIARAKRTVDAWNTASGAGRGVISVDGKMIDAPLVAVQQRILERASRAFAQSES
jgi:citrate lyase beta subunit